MLNPQEEDSRQRVNTSDKGFSNSRVPYPRRPGTRVSFIKAPSQLLLFSPLSLNCHYICRFTLSPTALTPYLSFCGSNQTTACLTMYCLN